jgi:hypothetical protein
MAVHVVVNTTNNNHELHHYKGHNSQAKTSPQQAKLRDDASGKRPWQAS